MPTFHAAYFVNNHFLASGAVEAVGKPDSIAYFCPTCGEVWARVVVEGCSWHVDPAPCEKHRAACVPSWGKVPGSLLTSVDSRAGTLPNMYQARAIENLPPAVLRREAEVLFNLYERGENYV